ncbi:hypothetical protein CDD80_4722 [Ophiocordyceps camponoti-rufipedis]|uniref:UvrD-like helicase ATP-binding domain-containing protein n=1 Tax=Ophiocordyceps camponoti-rufipedis TaxID=2004952 RepID=A0A2C5YZ39_9HYPO|nr:hypothetical protein CDD80_4722 [Ophiocordyceps camponoti-rufipedis]
MTDPSLVLRPWFEKLQQIPPEHHLLCAKLHDDDRENYKNDDDNDSSISVAEKKKRIQDGERRIEITYWNCLIFGFDKKDSGKWGEDFGARLENCLRVCSDCCLNWHMNRKTYLEKFSEIWNEDAMLHIEELLEKIDVSRIEKNLLWAQEAIEAIENKGIDFKKSLLATKDCALVLITVYEALCCVPYIANPEKRALFQFVFCRLQGKTYLRLGSHEPLPGMGFFLFDFIFHDRYKWATENWKYIPNDSMTELQFDWAVGIGIIKGINEVAKKDLRNPSTEDYLDIQRFWESIDAILRTMTDSLILSRLKSLEVRQGNPNIYDLLFRHIQNCRSEGVLVATIKVMTSILKKSPQAMWDAIGDAKPNVIPDMLFGSPVYKSLLGQSLDSWSGFDSNSQEVTPFPTSWIQPWLQSLKRDRRYDACEVFMYTLFESLARERSIGEAGQATCVRAGFDALNFTLKSFLEDGVHMASGSTLLYASSSFNLVVKYNPFIIRNIQCHYTNTEVWKTLKMADAARTLILTAMRLHMKILSEEYLACHEQKTAGSTDKKTIDSAEKHLSEGYWESVIDVFDLTPNQVYLFKDILACLGPLISMEAIRPPKTTPSLDEASKAFNRVFRGTTEPLVRIFSRVSELDAPDLNNLFSARVAFQTIVGLSVHGDQDLAEASVEVLRTWTGELSRGSALEHMTRLHPEQTISSIIWTLDKMMKRPISWGPIRPLLSTGRSLLQGLTDSSAGVLRTSIIEPRLAATILRWWNEQWRFISKSCLNIENWSTYVSNSIMTEFCREIMELAEALVAEDGLLATTIVISGKSEKESMAMILAPARENFRGMEAMIRLKDRWLVEVTVRVLCKILSRLRENKLEIDAESRRGIMDACIPTGTAGKYLKSTNLKDQQRAELLQALGQDDEVQVVQVDYNPKGTEQAAKDGVKKQSKLDAWSKSGPATPAAPKSRTNRDDVLELSKSVDSPILKKIEARRAMVPSPAKGPDPMAISAIKESRMRAKAEKAARDAEAIARAKQIRSEAGQRKSEMMVSSSDDDSDEVSDESETGDRLTAPGVGLQQREMDEERRRQQLMRDQLRRPVKKTRQQRSVKEMRARLIPPMDRLHNTILAWDMFHDGNDPPGGPAASEVATCYDDPASYQATFFPLLVSEAWRSFVTSKDELTSQPFGIKIASRASVDSFLEAAFTLPLGQTRERPVSEGDILLVSEAEKPLATPKARRCLARVHRIAHKKGLLEVTFRVASRSNTLTPILVPGSDLHGVKITNMTTIEREYAALQSLQYYDLMDEILKAQPSPILRYSEERVKNAMQNWALNRGQALAVIGAHDNDGFTLIQGPPGTGKTKTIVAMVGSLLSDQLANPMTGVPVRPLNAAQGQAPVRSKKLLVCAPSNAAVDELVLRLKAGVKTGAGKARNINVLRLGRSDAINAAVKDVTLDELVRKRLEGDTTRETAKADRDKLHDEAARIKEQLSQLRPRLEAARGSDDRDSYNGLSRQFEDLKRMQMNVGRQIDANKDSGNSIAREMEMRRRQVQQEILNSAHVLCATLSGSGHEMFRNLEVEFETVVIDEAAQCVELSALIPLKYGCCKCVLVGDPKQLPPTVLSQSAARFGYDQSLFVRMQQRHGESVHLLDTQYRMHPDISIFPSAEFYEGQLQDGPDMARLRRQPWHGSELLGPYRFFDIEGSQERGRGGQSLVNTRELEVAMAMWESLCSTYRSIDLTGKVGIITPYKAQLFELRSRFRARFGESITEAIEFNTTDAFQGRECEIIIFSCVRAKPTGGIGFMTDIRRMNVGLTRAKSSLWILGDSRALVQGEFWRKLVDDAKRRERYTSGDVLRLFRQPLARAKAITEGTTTTTASTVAPTMMAPTTMAPTTMAPSTMAPSTTAPTMMAPSTTAPTMMAPSTTAPSTTAPTVAPARDVTMTDADTTAGPEAATASSNNSAPARSGVGPPVIHTTTAKKRSLDNGQLPTAKRVWRGQGRGDQFTLAYHSRQMPSMQQPRGGGLMAKFGQPKRTPAPTDPSAMAVLGLTPPERPPAPMPTPAPMQAAGQGQARAPAQAPAQGQAQGQAAQAQKQTGAAQQQPPKTSSTPCNNAKPHHHHDSQYYNYGIIATASLQLQHHQHHYSQYYNYSITNTTIASTTTTASSLQHHYNYSITNTTIATAAPTLRLADAAISGTTIGGHRHMAISIPQSASEPRSQYPVYHQHQRLNSAGAKPFDYIGGLPIDEPVELAVEGPWGGDRGELDEVSVPVLPPKAPERRGRTMTTTTTVVGEVPIVTGSGPTRRDVVRDRKKRDVEALLAHQRPESSKAASPRSEEGSGLR